MATIKNVVETRFTTRGAQKVAKETESIGRAQTRLGQASASSGRQFSAQANGLGGLVSAYAGAAATIFAVTAAFTALQKAAQAEQVIAGTKALALEVGASGTAILAKIKEITKGQLSMAEAAQSANIALSAGFGEEQIAKLTKVSLQASRALGRSLTDAFTRLTRGTAKLEPELLDELGIFVRIEPAVEKYAALIGKAATSLTQFERRQAFVNAAIEEGEQKVGIINTSAETTLEAFEKLSATFQDLGRVFGTIAADFLAPIAKFFSKDLGNSLLLFLLVGRLVFGKAGEIIGGFTKKATSDLGRFADKLGIATLQKKKFDASLTQKTAEGVKGGFVGLGGKQANIDAKAAANRAKAGNVSINQMKKDRQALLGVTAAERKYRAEVRAGTRAVKDKTAALARSNARTKFAAATTVQYGIAIKQAGIANRILSGTAAIATATVTALGTALRWAMSALNVLMLAVGGAQLVGSLFDIDILGSLVGWFKSLGEEARKVREGLRWED